MGWVRCSGEAEKRPFESRSWETTALPSPSPPPRLALAWPLSVAAPQTPTHKGRFERGRVSETETETHRDPRPKRPQSLRPFTKSHRSMVPSYRRSTHRSAHPSANLKPHMCPTGSGLNLSHRLPTGSPISLPLPHFFTLMNSTVAHFPVESHLWPLSPKIRESSQPCLASMLEGSFPP